MANRQELVTQIFHNLSALRRIMHSQMPHHKADKHGPTPAQIGLMFALSHKRRASVKELAQCFDMTSSAATQLIEGAVNMGWVTRQAVPGDRRKVALGLLPRGERVLKKFIEHHIAYLAQHLKVLTERELQQLNRIHTKIIDQYR